MTAPCTAAASRAQADSMSPEARLAVCGKDVRNGAARLFFDHDVGVEKRQAQSFCELSAEGALAAAGKSYEHEIFHASTPGSSVRASAQAASMTGTARE